jgi:hypothetical protein
MGCVDVGHQRDEARYADRPAADHSVAKAHRRPVGGKEQIGRRGCRRRLAAVPGGHRAGRRIVVQQEGAAADAGTLRFNEVEHELGGDRRIDGTAAGTQHGETGRGCVGMRGDDHVPCRADQRLRLPAAGIFRRGARLRGGGEGDEDGGEQDEAKRERRPLAACHPVDPFAHGREAAMKCATLQVRGRRGNPRIRFDCGRGMT